MNKLIYLLLILFLAMPMASAFTWDNTKYYDESTQEYTIKNAFGLGSDIARMELKTPLKNYVPIGADVMVARINFSNYGDYDKTEVFNEMEFYDYNRVDRTTGEYVKVMRQVTWKYKTTDFVNVPDTNTVCESNPKVIDKISNNCEIVQNGTKKELKEVWKDFDSTIPKGNYDVGVFTETKVGDFIDLVPNIHGERMDSWFFWVSSLNTDLGYWYSFEEASGSTVYDNSTTLTHGQLVGSPTRLTNGQAKIKAGLNITAITMAVNLGTNLTSDCINNCSFFTWARFDTANQNNYILSSETNGFVFGILSTGKFRTSKVGVSA